MSRSEDLFFKANGVVGFGGLKFNFLKRLS